jgi:hypothetical protein
MTYFMKILKVCFFSKHTSRNACIDHSGKTFCCMAPIVCVYCSKIEPKSLMQMPANDKGKALRKHCKVCYKKGREEILYATLCNALDILDFVWNIFWTVSSVKVNSFYYDSFSSNMKVFIF